jgi:hypothetical protein
MEGPFMNALLKFIESIKKKFTYSQKEDIKRFLAFLRSNFYRNDLTKLALIFNTDKAGSHHYTQHYDLHFRKYRRKNNSILEIGVGGGNKPYAGGGSLRMWKAYFPNSKIFGIDIFDKTYHNEDRIKTFCGSQVDEDFLKKALSEIGDVDIIIDDGSHINEHVIKTFHLLFPHLRSGGIYVIEDVQTSYWHEFGGSLDKFTHLTSMNFLKSLVDGLNYEEFPRNGYEPTYFDKSIVSMHFYHNLVFIYKGSNNEGSNLIENSLLHERQSG